MFSDLTETRFQNKIFLFHLSPGPKSFFSMTQIIVVVVKGSIHLATSCGPATWPMFRKAWTVLKLLREHACQSNKIPYEKCPVCLLLQVSFIPAQTVFWSSLHITTKENGAFIFREGEALSCIQVFVQRDKYCKRSEKAHRVRVHLNLLYTRLIGIDNRALSAMPLEHKNGNLHITSVSCAGSRRSVDELI